MMENCAHARQQSCTFTVNVGPPGSVEFNAYAQNQITMRTQQTSAQYQLDRKDHEQLHNMT